MGAKNIVLASQGPILCIWGLNNEITTGFESGSYTGMILIDLQKTFDTVNHNVLLKKIEFKRFFEETRKWFKSYCEIRYSKFILRTLSQSLETSYADFLKDPF